MPFNILKEPYPLYKDVRKQLPFILGLGLFIFLFLYIFQPFEIDTLKGDTKVYYLMGFGLITSVILSISQIILPATFNQFFEEENWTIGKQFLYLLFFISLILAICYLYFNWYNGISTSLSRFFSFYSQTFALALFPVGGLILFDYISKLRIYKQQFPPFQQEEVPEIALASDDVLVLKDENDKEQLKVKSSDLYFLKAANNYVEIYYTEDSAPKKVILRSTLSQMEQQIKNPKIIRSHRSYIVNTTQIEQISGNAQGFKLHLKISDWIVPVSRSKGRAFVEELRTLIS